MNNLPREPMMHMLPCAQRSCPFQYKKAFSFSWSPFSAIFSGFLPHSLSPYGRSIFYGDWGNRGDCFSRKGIATAVYGGEKRTIFTLHLMEMRYRAFYFVFSLCVTFLTGTFYCSALTHLICTPFLFGKEKECVLFICTHVTEGLYAAVDVSIMYTFFFCAPLLIYHFYSFFIPSCYQREQSAVHFILFSAAALFLISLYAAFFFFLPKICTFLQQFQYESKYMEIKLEARIGPAVRWSCTVFLFTALFFQIPLFFLLLLNWGIIDCQFLKEKRRYAAFCLLLMSSLLSPPDVSSQCALAFSAFFFYELFLWWALFHRRWERSLL